MLTRVGCTVPVGPPQTYLTLSLRAIGFNTTETNLLSIPSIVLGMINLLIIVYISERVNSRIGTAVVLQIWALPLLIALYTFNHQTSQWVYFAVVTLVAGYPYVHPIQVAWASRNSYSVRTRFVCSDIISVRIKLNFLWSLELCQRVCTICACKLGVSSKPTSTEMMTNLSVSSWILLLCVNIL